MLNRYLDEMRIFGLVEIHHSPTKYLTTQKGRTFLELWKEIVEITMLLNGRFGGARRDAYMPPFHSQDTREMETNLGSHES
jgi:hypothetical protein